MNNKRLLYAVLGVFFFSIIVLVWYFYYAKPAIAPSLSETNNPIPTSVEPSRFHFLTWGENVKSTSTTEVTDPSKDPLVEIWNKGAVGQTFITVDVLKEVTATTTVGTSTVEIKKTVRASSTVVLFVDTVTGYVYGYPIETGEVYQISNTIVPGVYDAHFFNNGKNVVIQYVDSEKNQTGALVATLPSVPEGGGALPFISTTYLPSGVTSVAVNKRNDRVSYAVQTGSGTTFYTLSPSGTTVTASSPFREWQISYGGETLYATSKASAYIPGVTATLPSFDLVVDNRTGLLSLPSNSGDIVSSMWSNQGLVTFLTNASGAHVLPLTTLASKCAWGNNDFLVCAKPRTLPKEVEGLPDDWYQGEAHFVDDIVQIDKNTGEVFPYYTFSQNDGLFDVKNIVTSSSNDLLMFNNKTGGTLWLINTNLLGD